jgi:hypothetical protein
MNTTFDDPPAFLNFVLGVGFGLIYLSIIFFMTVIFASIVYGWRFMFDRHTPSSEMASRILENYTSTMFYKVHRFLFLAAFVAFVCAVGYGSFIDESVVFTVRRAIHE